MRCDTPEESGSSPRKSTERCMVNIFCRTEYIQLYLDDRNLSSLLSTAFDHPYLFLRINVHSQSRELTTASNPTRMYPKEFCIRGPKAMQCISYKSAPVLCHTRCSSPCTNVVQVNATSLAFSTTPSIHPASLPLVPYSIQPNGSEASISPEHHSKSIALDQQPKQIPHLSLHPSIKPSTLSK